jgi:hypothetical protein
MTALTQYDPASAGIFAAGAILMAVGVALGLLLQQRLAARADRRERDRLDTPPPSEGLLLTGQAGREALGATLQQLEGEPDAPTLCWMSGERVNHVGLMCCPAEGCNREHVDVSSDGIVEPHWTKAALPLPIEHEEWSPW